MDAPAASPRAVFTPFLYAFCCNEGMVVFLIHVLEAIFVLGVAGSALVVVLTTIDDVRELLLKSEVSNRDLEQHRVRSQPAVMEVGQLSH